MSDTPQNTPLALRPDHPEECDGTDFILEPGVRGVWITVDGLAVHICRGSVPGQDEPDAGLRVYVYNNDDLDDTVNELMVLPEDIEPCTLQDIPQGTPDRDDLGSASGEAPHGIGTETARNEAARDKAFMDYDFGEDVTVEATGSWEFDGEDTYSCSVFLQLDLPDDPTTKVTFRVQVIEGNVVSVEVA